MVQESRSVMKFLAHLGLAFAFLLLCTSPALAEDVTPVALELSFNFERLAPGQSGEVMITGWDVASAEGTFEGRPVHFHRVGESLVALIAASLEIEREGQLLEATVHLYSGDTVNYHLPVDIAWAGFGRQDIHLPSNLGCLLDPALNDAETEFLKGIYGQDSPQRFWDGPLQLPASGATTSPFGVYRVYNESLWARHSGQDIRAAIGTPVSASAVGRVVLAETLDIRGKTVIVDHGWGVFTGYCHFSEILVRPGQLVQAGETIGLSGTTGRTTGPHLHWELAVGGTWVDPLGWTPPALP
jgi:murein DD-endopeptidase MepM/ murein hydrolase activator NlpD